MCSTHEVCLQLGDKEVKLIQERDEKERLRDNFRQRLEMNNIHWEENLVGTWQHTQGLGRGKKIVVKKCVL